MAADRDADRERLKSESARWRVVAIVSTIICAALLFGVIVLALSERRMVLRAQQEQRRLSVQLS
jgi:hypothetical protein